MTRRSTSLFQVAAALFVLSTVLSGQDRRPSRQPSTAPARRGQCQSGHSHNHHAGIELAGSERDGHPVEQAG